MRSPVADLVVAGAGIAGVSAALEAAALGARVIVLEAAPSIGGTGATAAAGTCIAGSPLQESLGIDDSPDLALQDWLAWGGAEVDSTWAASYLEASAADVYGWLSSAGVVWERLHKPEGNRVARWHAPRGGGRAVMAELERHVRAHPSISVALRTRVSGFVTEGGRVTGVTTEGGAGEYRANAVLLATGGFSNDATMVRTHATDVPPDARVLLGGGQGAVGDGHRIARSADSSMVNLDAVWMYPYGTPDPADPANRRGLVLRGLDGDIWVNRAGRRFHNEDHRGGATGTPALLRQPGATCWAIVDATIAARITVADPAYRRGDQPLRGRTRHLLEHSPHIARADSITELADRAGIAPAQLDETITQYNGMLAGGIERDPDFDRDLTDAGPLAQPPFYAIQFFPLARKNLGGVRTTTGCEVVGNDGRAIPGLLAAGELAGMAGGHINGRAALEGTMFGPSLYSGRIAGRRALN